MAGQGPFVRVIKKEEPVLFVVFLDVFVVGKGELADQFILEGTSIGCHIGFRAQYQEALLCLELVDDEFPIDGHGVSAHGIRARVLWFPNKYN